MKRKDVKGKVKFLYREERLRLESNPILRSRLRDWTPPPDFISGLYITSQSASYLSVLRSDFKDYPKWLNVEQFNIVTGLSREMNILNGPYKTMSFHHTTPKEIKKIIKTYILLSA